MSACVSRAGEYSSHTTISAEDGFCRRCGVPLGADDPVDTPSPAESLRKTLTAQVCAEAQILKDLKAAHEQTRKRLADLFSDVGEREVGKLLDQRIGTVAIEAGAETWAVADEDLFEKWVHDQYGDFGFVSIVDPSIATALLAECKRHGGLLDPESGEVTNPPPGFAKRQGSPKLVARTEKHASFVVRHWLGEKAAGQLGIEAGP